MNVFEFNTDKMQWTKYTCTSAQYNMSGLVIKVTDAEYFEQLKPIFAALNQKNAKLVLFDHVNHDSFIIDVQRISKYNVIENKFASGANKDNVGIDCVIRFHTSYFTDLNNYWLYLMYE